MTRRTLATVAVAVGLGACGDGSDSGSSAVQSPSATAPPPSRAERSLGRPEAVPADANIFGAGRAEAPAPGGGGAGALPPGWRLPDGSRQIVTFPRVTGRVNPIVDLADYNGPAGDRVGPTDVRSYKGISGIVNRRNGMFLVGVFLADDPPAGKALRRLDFTRRERFDSLAPRIGQTFYVGGGRRRSYRVPERATRLFLGFADAYLYEGDPGWYSNNVGKLKVTVAVAGA